MAYYAFLDENNYVTEVIPGVNEDELIEGKTPEEWYGEFRGQRCLRTSYNTHGNVHRLNGTPFRKNYAGVGMFYDENRDAFLYPKPHASWTLNEDTCLWNAPVMRPTDGKPYRWNEEILNWEEVTE